MRVIIFQQVNRRVNSGSEKRNHQCVFILYVGRIMLLRLMFFLSLLILGSFVSFAQTNKLDSGSRVQPTANYRSLLADSVVVTNAVFEKELFLADIPSQARKQVFSLKFDGENYLLSSLKDLDATQESIIGGRFESLLWDVDPNNGVMFFNKRWNNPSSWNAVVATEAVMRMTANLFMNLGITEMVRSSTVWVGQNRITAKSTDGHDITVEFEGNPDAPTNASIMNERGLEYAYILYNYSPNFCGGHMPNEFSRFHSRITQQEAAKMFTVRISKLELVEGHIPPMTINPQIAFHFKRVIFYSNDTLYWENQNGVPQRVLTAEEAYKNMPNSFSGTKRGKTVRVAIIGAFSISAVAMVALLYKQTTKNRNKSKES